MRAARTKLSVISATRAIHTNVSGQWESVNESSRVGDRTGASVG